jgi:lipopolysaccharide transport system ATP-binding protein
MKYSVNKKLLISLRNIGVRFRQGKSLFNGAYFEALKNISFDLYQGDSLGIIGRNGVGKSTLLRCLGGIIRPDRGALKNNGYRTALLSLQLGFDSQLTGRDNAVLSGMLLGFRRREIKAKLEEIISFAELEAFIDQPLYTYSNGMRARLGFSVAFHLEPDILLIDEALAVGDANFRKKSLAVMEEKIRSDRTIVLVSHQSEVIRKLCNRAVWIEHGETQMEGEAGPVVQAYEAFLRQRTNPM